MDSDSEEQLDNVMAKLENGEAGKKDLTALVQILGKKLLGLCDRLADVTNPPYTGWEARLARYLTKRDARRCEKKADTYSADHMRYACDLYIISLFEYAAVNDHESAARVKQKFDDNHGLSYNPVERRSWPKIEKRILDPHLRKLGAEYDPGQVVRRYLDSSYDAFEPLLQSVAGYISIVLMDNFDIGKVKLNEVSPEE